MEEMVGDIPKCRAVFERWMEWQPDDNAWLSFARFETRCQQYEKAEFVLRRYCNAYPVARAFVKFTKWAEFECNNNIELARNIFESALTELEPEEIKQARLFKQFAAFEERQGEYERARVIYRHAIKLLKLLKLLKLDGGENQNQPKDYTVDNNQNYEDDDDLVVDSNERYRRDELYKSYIAFEKRHGSRENIETVIVVQQREQYKQRLAENPFDYDGWFELAKLQEDHQQQVRQSSPLSASSTAGMTDLESCRSMVRDTYERAIANC
jgi:crooked neck